MLEKPVLEDIVAKIDNLPELPHVALQVNQMLDNPNAGASELSKIIMMDPALTSKVLKLCNSAQYGLSRKIGTISEAVAILGHKELKQIIFTIISHSLLNRPVEGYALEKGALWQNAMYCAVFSRHIAKHFGFKDSELAFIGALLRDIGKIAMENYIKGSGLILENTAKAQRFSFVEAEEQVIGVSHTKIGSQLALRWNLPDSLVYAIAYHHTPGQMPQSASVQDKQLVAIVHLADTFTMMTGSGVGLDGLMYPIDMTALKYLNLEANTNELEALYADLLLLEEEITSLSSSLELGGTA
jgi:putative nucleotidyltransferase with HDIG domain